MRTEESETRARGARGGDDDDGGGDAGGSGGAAVVTIRAFGDSPHTIDVPTTAAARRAQRGGQTAPSQHHFNQPNRRSNNAYFGANRERRARSCMSCGGGRAIK